jgi:uncharacterized protein YeaO (DUF488 family)
MIRQASIYEARERSDEDGLRVLVMRHWPRGVRKERIDLWLKDAGPSLDLLRAYTHAGLAWATFEERYRREMLEERADLLERLRGLEREHGVLTLFCHERIPPSEHCHRQVLVDLLSRSSDPARSVGPVSRTHEADRVAVGVPHDRVAGAPERIVGRLVDRVPRGRQTREHRVDSG